MLTRGMYTALVVRDQDQALDFYTQNFGFVKRSDFDGPDGRYLTMRFEGQDIEVILWLGTQGPGNATRTAPAGVNLEQSLLDPGELFLDSDDLRKECETFQSNGVQFVEPAPEDYPFGVRVTALDPDGNRASLRQRRR
jgi:predicted enzyme related to lactoylglutathione lyase